MDWWPCFCKQAVAAWFSLSRPCQMCFLTIIVSELVPVLEFINVMNIAANWALIQGSYISTGCSNDGNNTSLFNGLSFSVSSCRVLGAANWRICDVHNKSDSHWSAEGFKDRRIKARLEFICRPCWSVKILCKWKLFRKSDICIIPVNLFVIMLHCECCSVYILSLHFLLIFFSLIQLWLHFIVLLSLSLPVPLSHNLHIKRKCQIVCQLIFYVVESSKCPFS